jgi:hypothetical protein
MCQSWILLHKQQIRPAASSSSPSCRQHRAIPIRETIIPEKGGMSHHHFMSIRDNQDVILTKKATVSRRHFLDFCLCMSAAVVVPPFPSNSVVMEQPKEKVFEAGQAMGIPQAKQRFQEARKTLDYLIVHYDDISKEGGDNVRRYLGTVGTTSPMYGITKVVKELQEESNDAIEFIENASEFDYYLRAADTAVYSANFVEYSAAKTPPSKFFADAKADCIQMKKYMSIMASELGLE